jgi:hypothetical protein
LIIAVQAKKGFFVMVANFLKAISLYSFIKVNCSCKGV